MRLRSMLAAARRSWPWFALAAACTGPAPSPTGPDHRGRPPQPAPVRDGLADDIDHQETLGSLFANWDPFADPDGGLLLYEWCVGSTPGAGDVLPWTAVGGATAANTGDLPLDDGAVLYVSVRATDLAGNRSAISTSDGVRLGSSHTAATPTGPVSTSAPGSSGALAAVAVHGVTWTFARPVPCGRFANGDWWVQGPIEIVDIQPRCSIEGGRTRHGSMVDPDPRSERQGYDSAMFGDGAAGRYDPQRNVALGVDRSHPLRLLPGSSLVSAISNPQAGNLPQLDGCAVLTCLAEPPPDDAFRPPYCGSDKACTWRASALDLTRLATLEAVPGAPDLQSLTERFQRPWLDHVAGWSGRYLHPRDHLPDYGRDLADLVGQAALALLLDVPEADKRPLAVALVQLGIDNAGVIRAGGRFPADGGSGSGRKFPILLAAHLLQDLELFRLLADHPQAFAEDAQTFFVAETAPGVINGGHGGYGPGDVGLPEWGNRHGDDPRHDRKEWMADPYRRCCTANAWVGYVLATRILGLQAAWGHPPLFAYVDRYLQIEPAGSWTRAFHPFAERMWDRYRRDC